MRTWANERSILCLVGGRCVDVLTACTAEHAVDDGDPTPAVAPEKGHLRARARLADDGTVAVVGVVRDDPARLCPASSPQRLWSTTTAPIELESTAAPLCTIVRDRAHFLDVADGTERSAYVQKGDHVQLLARGDDPTAPVVVRYVGAKRTTIGALDPRGLDCPPSAAH